MVLNVSNTIVKHFCETHSNTESILNAKPIFFMAGIILVCLVASLPNSAFGATLRFDAASYYNDHSFILTVADQQSTQPSVTVTVISAEDPSHLYTLTLTDAATGTYTSSPITFVTSRTNTFPLLINPVMPETITASYTPLSPTDAPNITASAMVISSEEGTWPPSPMSPQPFWGKRIWICSSNGGDADNDGICDGWENSGKGLIVKYQGTLSVSPPAGYWIYPCVATQRMDGTSVKYIDPVCPGSDKPDVYVEVDYMKGHKPTQAAIDDVKSAFANAPVETCPAGHTKGTGDSACKWGVRLHVLVEDQTDPDTLSSIHKDIITAPIAGGAGGTDFDAIKKKYFGTLDDWAQVPATWSYQWNLTSKKQVFHYAEFIHSQTGDPGSSGTSEQPGNDFVISLGNWYDSIGSQDQQEGTFMHELGHNVGLYHGGGTPPDVNGDGIINQIDIDADNCKPNYLSVMSYSLQLKEFYPINRLLDYSHTVLSQLTESNLNEGAGIGVSDPTGQWTVYGVQIPSDPNTLFQIAPVDNSNIQWDGRDPPNEPSTSGDVNMLVARGCGPLVGQTLSGYNDWINLNFNSKSTSGWNDGVRVYNTQTGLSYDYQSRGGQGGPQPAVAEDNSQSKVRLVQQNEIQAKEKSPMLGNVEIEKILKNLTLKTGKRGYHLPSEITYDIVQEIRKSRLNALKFHISQQYPSGKLGAETKELFADLDKVNDLTMQNDFNNAISTLAKAKEKVQKLDISNEGKKEILSEIDDNIGLLKIASTLGQHEAKEKMSVAPKESSGTTKLK